MASQPRPSEACTWSAALIVAVAALRVRRRWSKAELERRIVATGHPLAVQAWSKLERGVRLSLTVDEFVALCRVFGMSASEMLGAVDADRLGPDRG